MTTLRKLVLSEPDFALKTYVIVPHSHLEIVSTEILELGALEIITPEKLEVYKREIREIAEYYNLLENSKKLYEEIVSQLDEEVTIKIKYVIEPSQFRELVKKLNEKLGSIANEVRGLNEISIQLKNNIEDLELLKTLIENVISRYPDADTSFIRYGGKEFIIDLFQGPSEQLSRLQAIALHTIAYVSRGDKALTSLIFTAKEYSKIMEYPLKDVKRVEIVERYGLRPLKEVLDSINKDLSTYRDRFIEIMSQKRNIIIKNLEDIALVKIILDHEYERVKALYEASKSYFVTLIIGWIPRSRTKLIENLAKEYPIQVLFEESVEPPAEFDNLRPFKPFELVTEMNGAPAKTDWDPTPLLAYAFALFFGLMMADVGYSIGLLLATKYILPIFVEDPKTEGVRRLQNILYVVGFSGIAVGVLSKSFFGDLLGRYIPLQQPLISTMDASRLIILSLMIGWAWIFLSHVLAFVKCVKKLRDVYGALTELSIIAIMVLGTLMILHLMYTNKMIERIDFIEENYITIRTLLIASIAILVFSKVKTVGPLGAILWIFDVAGILGDVFSFIRIAGIALGTAILAYIFNLIIGGAISINIVLGVVAAIGLHFFAFALTPISPFIHSLRLCMLEISSKFYEGMNRRTSPLKVFIPSRLTIGGRRRI